MAEIQKFESGEAFNAFVFSIPSISEISKEADGSFTLFSDREIVEDTISSPVEIAGVVTHLSITIVEELPTLL